MSRKTSRVLSLLFYIVHTFIYSCFKHLKNATADGLDLVFQEVVTEEFDDTGAKDSVSFAEKWYVTFLFSTVFMGTM